MRPVGISREQSAAPQSCCYIPPMNLYLVRHGKAVDSEVDPERSLSDRGLKDVSRLASYLEDRITVPLVLHSGKKRAEQTGSILADAIGAERIEQVLGIAPMDSSDYLIEYIAAQTTDVLVAGHLPHLGNVVSRLVTGSESVPVVHFKTSTLVRLELDDTGCWVIRWVLSPELFR